jgi:hypothetical protein
MSKSNHKIPEHQITAASVKNLVQGVNPDSGYQLMGIFFSFHEMHRISTIPN